MRWRAIRWESLLPPKVYFGDEWLLKERQFDVTCLEASSQVWKSLSKGIWNFWFSKYTARTVERHRRRGYGTNRTSHGWRFGYAERFRSKEVREMPTRAFTWQYLFLFLSWKHRCDTRTRTQVHVKGACCLNNEPHLFAKARLPQVNKTACFLLSAPSACFPPSSW